MPEKKWFAFNLQQKQIAQNKEIKVEKSKRNFDFEIKWINVTRTACVSGFILV